MAILVLSPVNCITGQNEHLACCHTTCAGQLCHINSNFAVTALLIMHCMWGTLLEVLCS